ncbi:MAG TPA: ribosome silencing factor [Bacillota bacterium]|nr:ribosome silencing factor [Bacillota bacterium]
MELELLKISLNAVEEKKAFNPLVLDLNGISGVTDYFLICSGNTPVQVRAIADNVVDKLLESGIKTARKEGYAEGRWVLLDFGNTIIHILHQEERDFYSLENLWHDAKIMQLS